MPSLIAQKILKTNQLKATSGRIAVLELFIESNKVLSHGDIEKALVDKEIDRVTIYRILDCFVTHKLIHKVSSEQSLQLFALSTNHSHKPEENHAHFVCDACESVECVEIPVSIGAKSVEKQLGYQISTIDITLHGICADCKQ